MCINYNPIGLLQKERIELEKNIKWSNHAEITEDFLLAKVHEYD